MKKLLAIFIAIMVFVPSFVYAEGGSGMGKSTGYGKIEDIHVLPGTTNSGQYSGYETGDITLKKVPGGVYSTDNKTGKKTYRDAKTGQEYDAMLYDLYDAQKKSRIAALQKQKDNALSSLAGEQSALKGNYYNKRNQAAAHSDVGALNFAQFMAGRGITGNAGAMPEIYRNNALQGQIGALDMQEAQDNAQIESNRTAVNNAYNNDVAAAEALTQSDLLTAQINQMNADKVTALEQQRYDDSVKRDAEKTAYSQLRDTKNEYANTIGRYSNDYQAQINNVLNDGDPSNDWQVDYLGAARTQKIQDQKDAAAATAAAQAAAEAKAQQQAFENDLKTKQLGLDTMRTNYTINRPYGGGGSNKSLTPLQQLNQTNNAKVSNMLNWIYSGKTTNDQIQNLVENKTAIIQQLIEAGYDGSSALKFYGDLYNELMQ